MNSLVRTIVLIGIAAAGGAVSAQYRDLNDAIRGSGLFTFRGRGQSLTDATVRLDSRGDFTIQFRGAGSPSFEGVWTESGGGITLNVKYVNGRNERVSGRGTLTMAGRSAVRGIELSGKVDEDAFSVSFTARDNGGPTGPGWGAGGSGWSDAFNHRSRGRGVVEFDGLDNVREAIVAMKGNGDFDIQFIGDIKVRVTGQWNRRGNGSTYDLDVDRAFDRSGSRGTGTLTRDRDGSVRTIQMKGSANGRSFRIAFDSAADGRPDYDDSFDATIRGSGTLRVDRDSSRLDRADIAIRSDRTFVIKVDGQKDVVFKGRWTRNGRDYSLTLTDGFSRRITGNGRVRMRDDRRVESIDMSGVADGRRFTVSVVD
ncbi:MAG: hypothetical protein KIS66_04265 [Fimbriimonadaceae bacterium]|nr:hypothetical protein [Fimbriimonadaceae bacterium]